MTDPKPTSEVREVIETWASVPEKAKEDARAEAKQVGWRIYLITIIAASLISALLSASLIYTFLTAWSSDWDIEHASGRNETCSRTHGGFFATPHYVCAELR